MRMCPSEHTIAVLYTTLLSFVFRFSLVKGLHPLVWAIVVGHVLAIMSKLLYAGSIAKKSFRSAQLRQMQLVPGVPAWTLVLPDDDGYCRVALWSTAHTTLLNHALLLASVSGGLLASALSSNHDLIAGLLFTHFLTLLDCRRPAAMADVQLEQPVLTPVGKPLSLMYAKTANTLHCL